MSVLGLERSHTSAADAYDHAISLVDATKPVNDVEATQGDSSVSPSISRTASGTLLSSGWNKATLRKELARRKYRRWQEDKTDTAGPADGNGNIEEPDASQTDKGKQDTGRSGRLRDRVPFWGKKRAHKSSEKEDTFIDVLYENQRGSFICGIPLYSSKSLLNFDPSGWQTSNFQDSAVNITNAQLPNPGWAWAWRTWYVDMSHDVDEEGWQYSFSFQQGFSWHGNHPWFHSFVRRRRWLRKRVRIHPPHTREGKGDMKEAHMLNEDYFTIHAARRDQSRGSSVERSGTIARSSMMGSYNPESDSEEEFHEIPDISSLMAALKKARLDREKNSAVEQFIIDGGDELFYLAESMSDIMAEFIHQTSRRQLQAHLFHVLEDAEASKDEYEEDQEIRDAKKRRFDNLVKAVHAAAVNVNDLDDWSDLRGKAPGGESGPIKEGLALDATENTEASGEGPHDHSDDREPSVREEIKGIPDKAQVSQEPRIRFDTAPDTVHQNAGEVFDKGKGKLVD